MAKIIRSGDSAAFIQLGHGIDIETHARVSRLNWLVNSAGVKGIIETVPSYTGLMVYYDPLSCDYEKLEVIFSDLAIKAESSTLETPDKTMVIPVCYDQAFGPDQEYVAELNHITLEELIELHSGATYHVYMVGFTPGFPYMGGLPGKISAPRKAEPRLKVAAGSVGIAGDQTGIYPSESPGGWQIIGRTPLKIFDLKREPHFLIETGTSIRFLPVDIDKYHQISRSVELGDYKIEIN